MVAYTISMRHIYFFFFTHIHYTIEKKIYIVHEMLPYKTQLLENVARFFFRTEDGLR